MPSVFKVTPPKGRKILTVGEVLEALKTMPPETELHAEVTVGGKLKAIIVKQET